MITSDFVQQYENKIFSQFGEDGVTIALNNLFLSIPHSFLEIGCGNGTENNTRVLHELGWTGVWIDASIGNILHARKIIRPQSISMICAKVSIKNAAWVKGLMAEEFGVLSIDIDGQDYYLWNALCGGDYPMRPWFVIIETQIQGQQDEPFVMAQDDDYEWDHKRLDVGANLIAMRELGHRLGYKYLGMPTDSVNAFFVRRDLT